MPSLLSPAVRRPLEYGQGLFRLPQSIWLPIIAMCAVAIGASVFNEWSVRRIRAGDDELAALTLLQQDLAASVERLSAAEAGQRGFLLLGEARQLAAYEQAARWLPVLGERMRVQAGDDPLLRASVQQLESERAQGMALLRSSTLLAVRGQAQAARALLSSGEGRGALDAFREHAAALSGQVQVRVAALREGTARQLQWTRFAFAALGLLTLVLLVTAVRLLVKDFWRQEAARQAQLQERLRLEQVVAARTAELSDLTSHLQSVTEQEKAQLARDLHDELGGLLTAARMDLSWLQGRASAAEPEAQSKLAALAGAIDTAMSLKRRVVESLRPALLDHFGLAMALQSHFETTCEAAGLRCRSQIVDDEPPLPQDMAIALFRVAQEALTNVLRHAHAQTVDLRFSSDADGYRMSIADDGIGFDPARSRGGVSHGIGGMRHRIRNLGGEFTLRANVPRGSCIEVSVPRSRGA
jgi:signal transduction histidine kinase